jgi:hypothetical protein
MAAVAEGQVIERLGSLRPTSKQRTVAASRRRRLIALDDEVPALQRSYRASTVTVVTVRASSAQPRLYHADAERHA